MADEDWDPFADPAEAGESVEVPGAHGEKTAAEEAEERARAEARAQHAAYSERMAGRPYAVVVHGATGFSGTFLVEHLDSVVTRRGGAGRLSWAISGRSSEKLRRIASRCKTKPDVIQACTPEEISSMASSCQVVCAAAGPFSSFGEVVVASCVEHSTHYVDITGDALWIHDMIQKYHAEAKAKGAMIVHCSAFNCAIDDLACYQLTRSLGPLKQYREYFLQVGPVGGGSFSSSLESMDKMTAEGFETTNDPFSLGGLRACGVRREDTDCWEAEEDPLFTGLWLVPAYNSQTGSRMIRRSCQLFEEAPSDGVQYGRDFSAVIRDLAPNRNAADRQIKANGLLPDPAAAPVAAHAMRKQLEEGSAPLPGEGPVEKYRAEYFSEVFAVAEGEDGQWAHIHYTGPEAYDVTALACITGALVLVEEAYKIKPWERGGVLTPAFAYHGSTYVARLQAQPFAGRSDGKKMAFRLQKGLPESDQVRRAMEEKKNVAMRSTAMLQSGEFVHPWAPPLLCAEERVWSAHQVNAPLISE